MTRVRFAPSPTGNLHIGTLRTALFAWLYAKSTNGQFVLRIEDTDQERSEAHYETSILEGLDWMGLTIDEGPTTGGNYGPYRQSERMAAGLYQKMAQELLDKGQAYYCFDTPEELELERQAAINAKKPYVYSRNALTLSPAEVQDKLAAKKPYTIRFKMPDSGTLKYTDLIRGEVAFELNLIGDFVIMKSDGSPSYNFAVVVDDIGMAISHVVRGEDHISNMPRQLCLYDAFQQQWPLFAHMPMILGADKSKLSKRHGATNVIEYKQQGYLADALFNFLALLGWSPEGEAELLSRSAIKSQFSLDRISKSNAVFDTEKLNWMNGQYIRQLDQVSLMSECMPYVSSEVQEKLQLYTDVDQQKALVSIQDNLETLLQVNEYLDVYIMTDDQFQSQLQTIKWQPTDRDVIKHLTDQFHHCDEWNSTSIIRIIDNTMSELSLGKGKVMKPLRLVTTAQSAGPYIVDILDVFGKEKTLQRLSYDHIIQ